MSFFGRKDESEISLVIDISSGSTAGAIVRNFQNDLPSLISSIRTPFFSTGKPSRESIESAMLASLNNTLTALVGSLSPEIGKINKTLLTFSSPWVESHLKTVIIDRETKFTFNERDLDKIMKEEQELFLAKANEEFKEECEIFESSVTNLYFNGYESQTLIKEKVNKVEVSFILSAISKDLLQMIEAQIMKIAHVKRGLVTHSFMYAFFKTLSHSFINLHSALLLNMTSELTDALFLRHGNSAFSASLPFGPNSIVRSVADRLGIQEPVAQSYLSIFASGAFDEATTNAVDSVLLEVEENWLTLWKNMGESIPEGKSLPYSIFLIAPTGFEKLMKTFLEGIFEKKNIILLGDTNAFTKEIVRLPSNSSSDENILILTAFSNLLK